MMQNGDGSVQGIENVILGYLDGEDIKNILSPGEYSEWPLTLKDGQVVIAQASSDAFDPAIEVTNDKGKVQASNDDRYPGDQRPLLLWRCEKAGAYSLRVRCFHDRSGGQFFLRLKVYDSVDLGSGKPVAAKFDKQTNVLLRVPMKAGEIKQVIYTTGGLAPTMQFSSVISPTGLPDMNLAGPMNAAIPNAVMAPVDGDYYLVVRSGWLDSQTPIVTRSVVPSSLNAMGGVRSAKATTNVPLLWEFDVKAGDIVEASTPELDAFSSKMIITEKPDISKYDLKKPETNPFYPHTTNEPDKGPAFVHLAARARDSRTMVFAVKRDAHLWLASNGAGPQDKPFTVTVKPAPRDYVEGSDLRSKLRVGNTDYWAFDAKVGDVMTLTSGAGDFAERVMLRDPSLNLVWESTLPIDVTSTTWDLIVQTPGRYLASVSCMGDGGGGDYSLTRKVVHAKEFSKGSPAKGNTSDGSVQVWRFNALPDVPLLIRWTAPNWAFRTEVRDETGAFAILPQTQVGPTTRYGILKVDRPKTFLIVMFPEGQKIDYSIEINDLPGYGKG